MRASPEPRKISPSHDGAIEQAGKPPGLFVQYDAGFRQGLSVGRQTAGEPAVAGKRWRCGALGSKGAGLADGTKLLWITLDLAHHDRRIVVGISVWAPGYLRTVPSCIEKNDEFAALIARGIKVFLAVCRKLAIGEDRGGAAATPCIQLNPFGKHTS